MEQTTARRRSTWVGVFLGLCALLGLVAVKVDLTPAPTHVSADAGWTPADGFRDGGKCYENIAFRGPVQVPCSSWHPLPQPVRQCTAAVIIAGLGAFFTHAPVGAAMGTTGGGCLAGLF